jgi:hypothetical protein
MVADWRTEARRYELRDIGPTCFAQGQTGFLQFIAELPRRGIGLPLQSMQESHDGAGRAALALRRQESAHAPPK